MSDNMLVMKWNIWINGKMLDTSSKECITTVEHKETETGADVFTIQISDVNFSFIEDNIFVEENPVRLMYGFDTDTFRIDFKGFISAIDINFDNDGVPKLTIYCMDNTHLMNRKKKNRVFNNTTTAEVVVKVVKEYGFTPKIEPNYKFTKQETITQSNQTDAEFLQSLAKDEVYPFTARLVGKEFLYVKSGKLGNPVMDLTYRNYPHDIMSFSPHINKETRKEEIKTSNINSSSKKVSETRAEAKVDSNSPQASNSNSSSNKKGSYVMDGETGKFKKI